MRTAVITLHSVCNYGTQLQAFATQKKLEQYFDEVNFIDYRREDTYGIGLLKTFTKGNILKVPIIIPTLIYWKYVFGRFQKRNLSFTKQKYLNDDDLKKFIDEYDVYFTGSDQVWNTGWNNGIIPAMYLNFIPNNKPKYAYASSFGKTSLNKNEILESKKYITHFSKITVRENSGVDILKKQYGYDNCERIIDPTLAFDGDFWRKYAPNSKIKEPYILIYNLNRSKEFDLYAEQLSKKTGYKLYRFCTRFDQIFRNGKSLVIPHIFEFISLIDNAKIVLTDSFHATAFSMNLNTEPICIYPESYSSRLSEFLKLVGAEHRHAINYDDFDVLNRQTDFKKVNKILSNERKKIDNYLNDIIKEVKNEKAKK